MSDLNEQECKSYIQQNNIDISRENVYKYIEEGKKELVLTILKSDLFYENPEEFIMYILPLKNSLYVIEYYHDEGHDFSDTDLIYYACIENNLEYVKFLIEHGTDIDKIDDFGDGHTPIMTTYSEEIVEYLLEEGADISIKDHDGMDYINYTCFLGDLKTLKCAIEYKGIENIDLTSKDNKGNTALHTACLERHVDVVKYLISKGACIYSINDKRESILQTVSKSGNDLLIGIFEKYF